MPLNDLKNGAVHVLVVFLVSRLFVFSILFLFSHLEFVKTSFSGRVRETRIDLGSRAAPSLHQTFVVGDGEWFRSIAEEGYAREPFQVREQRNWAFLPGLPLLLRYARVLPSYAANAILISNVLFLAGLFFLYRVSLESGLDHRSAQRALTLLAFFPTSYFFSLPTSESLFLLCAAGSWWAATRNRWAVAGAAGALAAATRVTGILLLPSLLILYWQRHRRLGLPAAWLLLIPIGLGTFMIFLWHITGNAFAFADIQLLWNRRSSMVVWPYVQFFAELPIVSVEWNFRLIHAVSGLVMLFASAALALRRRYAMGFFLMATLAVALSSGSLQSLARYSATAFPLFLVLAESLQSEKAAQYVIGFSAGLLGVLTCLFAIGIDIGLS